jgi:fluoride ion exporter CrcB/FEX
VAAYIIILLSVAGALLRMHFGRPLDLHEDIEFGTFVLNALSLLWFGFILAKNERKPHAEFGEAVRREIPTVLLALFVSLAYSLITLFHTLLG